ncbi:hypothetical protein HanIR_Chr16g0844581 [Helianthus annuus]|nr:hypothetical protein HanIR_Chr16g0844581 [Helianthus annuus]
MLGGGGGYSTVLPTAEVIPPRRPPPSKPESGSKSATVRALGTSKTRTRHLRVRMRASGHWADTQWLLHGMLEHMENAKRHNLFGKEETVAKTMETIKSLGFLWFKNRTPYRALRWKDWCNFEL